MAPSRSTTAQMQLIALSAAIDCNFGAAVMASEHRMVEAVREAGRILSDTPPAINAASPPPQERPPDAYSIPETAAILGVSGRQVWRIVAASHLMPVRSGRRSYISRSQLLVWLKSTKESPGEPGLEKGCCDGIEGSKRYGPGQG